MSNRAALAVVSICFLISGAAGLIYQVVWSRYLALFLGHTSYAVVAVLVAFMGGLALGNAWFGICADRTQRPLALYGWLEIGIGAYAVLFPVYYSFCHDAFVGVARAWQVGSTGLLWLKFVFSFLLILLPTVLMGATFPVLTRFVTRSLAELQGRVAWLYAINSVGAVAGCLIADFWSIPTQGLEVTIFTAAALNFLVGLVALGLSFRMQETQPASPGKLPTPAKAGDETYTPAELRLAIVGIGVSGFVAMLYEVAWTRLLGLALGSSTHAFSVMLITFITGLALGAGVVCLWSGLRRTLAAFGWAELALAATLFGSMLFYEYLPFWFIKVSGLLARREQAYPLYELAQALICFSVMLLPTVCLGMTLPLVSRIATVELARTGRSVGTVFAVNTLGTVLGAVLTGLWLMPAAGLARTFVVGIGLNALIGAAALTCGRSAQLKAKVAASLLVVLAVAWMTGAELDPVWQRTFSLGRWRSSNPAQTIAQFRDATRSMTQRYHRDGAGSTVDVLSWTEGGQELLTLNVNGKADAGNARDMVTQLLLGHIPMLLRPQSTQALIIGFGSGMTCAAIARHPTVQRVDAVEISPEVIQAAKLFTPYNDDILSNPKLHLAIEDAKSFLQITERQYDLIVSEPSNPWMAGVAAVFSREYYETCAARLQPTGVVAQWMHFYEITDDAVSLVMRTFLSVFPYMSVWQPGWGDLVLVGSRQPLAVDLEAMRRRFSDPNVRADLAKVGLLTLPTVLAREVIPQQNGLFTVPAEGPVHSDYFPQLEYMAQRGFFLNAIAENWRRYREDFSPRAATLVGLYLRQHPLTEADFQAFARDYQEHKMPEPVLLRSLLQRWQGNSTQPQFPLELWATASDRTPAAELRVLRLAGMRDSMLAEAGTNAAPLRFYAIDLMETYRVQRSIFFLPPSDELERILQRLIATDPAHQRVYRLNLAELAWDRGDDARCLTLGQSALDPDTTKSGPIDFSLDPQAPLAVLYRMMESFWRRGQVAEAWSLCQQASAGGYLAQSDRLFPPLEVSYRRIEAAAAQLPKAASNLPR